MVKYLRDDSMNIFMEFIDTNKQLSGLEAQKEKMILADSQISDLVKKLASERKSINQIAAGIFLIPMSHKEAIKILQDKKKEIEIGIKGLDEQLRHRSDNFDALMIKIYKLSKSLIPKDVVVELEKGE